MASLYRPCRSRVALPIFPSAIVLPSTFVTGVKPPKVPVTNASSAEYTSVKEKGFSNAFKPFSLAISITSSLVIPFRQYYPVDVQTCPFLTMKKFVALHVATAPVGSSIKASSAPASMACTRAITSWSFE